MQERTLRENIAFLERAAALKDTCRSGFTPGGRSEDTAAHSWGLCLWLVLMGRDFDGLDLAHALRMAVIHDLGEAISGDIPATEQTGSKTEAERADFQSLLAGLAPDRQNDLLALWDEYEAGQTPEAQVVKGLDKLETILTHGIGDNPPDFDYGFNLGYGRARSDRHPLLRRLRAVLDERTRARMADRQS